MNVGIILARGKVILHLHSDDCLASYNVLAIVHDAFLNSRSSLVIGNCKLKGLKRDIHWWPENRLERFILRCLFFPILFFANHIPHPSSYVMRTVFEKYGNFKEQYKTSMDYDFWLRVLRYESSHLIDDVLSENIQPL